MKPQSLHEFSYTGDIYGGMWILAKANDDSLYVEAWQGPDEGDDEPVYPWTTFTVFRTPLPGDVYVEHDWVRVAKFPEADTKAGRDPDPIKRAHELANLASHFGWEELDHYPLKLTATELWERWGNTPSEDTRQNYLDSTYDAPLVDAELPVKLSDRERDALFNHGVDRLYAALVSSEMGAWDFWQALAEAVRRIGATHDADAGEDSTHRWAVGQTLEHLGKMDGAGVPREEAVAFLADPKAGVAKVVRPRESAGKVWPTWQEEKKT